MAELLYRLGKGSSLHPWRAIVAWLLALLVAGGSYLAFGGTLSSSVTIPGTATAEVTDRLQAEFPDASGGTGTILFHTADGSALTDDQRADISAALADVAALDGVQRVVDPFQAEADREAQAADLQSKQAQADDGRTQAEAGQAQLDAGRADAEAGQAALDAARAAAEADGTIVTMQAAFDAQQAVLDAGAAELDSQQQVLDATFAQLDAAQPALTAGQQLIDAASGLRTVSEDGSAAVASVQFTLPAIEVDPDTKGAVVDAVEAADLPASGVEADFSNELTQTLPTLGGASEVIGVAIAGIVLFVMLGTLIGAGLPLVTALVGVGVGAAGALALSGVVDMMSVTPILGVMLGLAVGIDYALFILNRHRRQLREGADVHESIGLANGTSGNAVVFAGSTVVIALLALNLTGIPFLGLMGTVAAACVVIAVLVAVTLTPALLGLAGLRLLPRKQRADRHAHVHGEVAPMSTPRAWLRVVAGIAVLGIVAIPAASMRLGLPDGTSEATDSTQYRSYTLTAQEFGEGVNGPLVVVADIPTGLDEAGLTVLQADIVGDLMAQDDVVAVAPGGVSEDGSLAIFQVIPQEGPNSESTEVLVHTLRDLSIDGHDDVTLSVAGFASGNIDVSEKLSAALPLYLVVVVGLSVLILMVVFRSLVVPLIATGGFVLSVLAAFGGVTAIYQWGWLGDVFGVHDPAPILSFLPILLVGILFGLAMDYQLFLTSGMREAYVHGSPARRAVAEGFHAGRHVVTAAAIIMISVFGGFIFSHTAIIRPIGFGLAFGVLVDAFVVRMLVMPAIMHLVGEKAWWLPRWLDRLLPDVDVEGASLERRHHAPDHTPEGERSPAGKHAAGGDTATADDGEQPATSRA